MKGILSFSFGSHLKPINMFNGQKKKPILLPERENYLDGA